jgi:kynurenine formamidase
VQAKAGHLIAPQDMPRLADCELLLVKTGFEKYRRKEIYWRNSPGLSPELAGFLRKKCP